jgi:endonuclease G, mitochondrial
MVKEQPVEYISLLYAIYEERGYDAPDIPDLILSDNAGLLTVISFYLFNIVPQTPANNQTFWKAVEERFRDYVNAYGSLFIITGAIFDKPLPQTGQMLPSTIGKDCVGVPTWLFKIALRELPDGHYETLAIEVPNLSIPSASKDYCDAMTQALISIDAIEKDTGLDFLNALPVAEQERIESKAAARLWTVSGIPN